MIFTSAEAGISLTMLATSETDSSMKYRTSLDLYWHNTALPPKDQKKAGSCLRGTQSYCLSESSGDFKILRPDFFVASKPGKLVEISSMERGRCALLVV
jgi:hypothetical protein